jgi:hypothetical protein
VGLAGCSSTDGGDEDDFDPELAAIVVENLDDATHMVTIEVFRGPDGTESVLNRTREMGASASGGSGPTEWRISEFPGRGTEFTLVTRVDDGESHEFESTIEGCTRFRVELRGADAVDVSEEGKTICYQG